MNSSLKKNNIHLDMAAGMVTGISSTIMFHPVDRAIYLSITNKRLFFSNANFLKPWQGLTQNIVSRPFSMGCYYFLQSQIPRLLNHLNPSANLSSWKTQLANGFAIGGIKGFLCNGLYVIRSQTWTTSGKFYAVTRNLLAQKGISGLFTGAPETVIGNILFSATYEMARNAENEKASGSKLAYNIAAGSLASIVASPVNYIRAIKYSTPADQTPREAVMILKDLWKDAKSSSGMLPKLGFFQKRLLIGCDTVRVGLGMAAGQWMYDTARDQFNKKF